jgi:hypothetical protein
MDKLLKIALRLWFTFVSVLTFLVGWVMFANSSKPTAVMVANPPPQVTSITIPQLAPIPSLQQLQLNPQIASSSQTSPSINLKLSPSLPLLRTKKS